MKGKKTRSWQERNRLAAPDEVDDEVVSWLNRAYRENS
jgi:hypothetical protein